VPVLRQNSLVICPAGATFHPVGTVPDPAPKFAVQVLARVRMTQGVVQVEPGSTLVRAPGGIYVILAEQAYDEAGNPYAAGTTLFIPPDSAVSVAAKVAVPGTDGTTVVPARPYPKSARGMAAGMAMLATAVVIGAVAG